MEKTKDTIINFKSTTLGKNSKGGDRIQLSMSQEEVARMIETLTTHAGNDRGVKLDVHVSVKETNDGSRTFLSGFSFVKPIQEFGANKGGGNGGNVRYVSKGKTTNTSFKDKLNKELG